MVEARRVIAELEQEAIRLAAAEKRLQVAVEQVGVRMKAMAGLKTEHASPPSHLSHTYTTCIHTYIHTHAYIHTYIHTTRTHTYMHIYLP